MFTTTILVAYISSNWEVEHKSTYDEIQLGVQNS